MGASDTPYQLGSDATELERLDHQGRLLALATRVILKAAGVGAGMRILDLGSGAGDVAFVAADLVGPAGEVVGLDRSQDAVARANLRAGLRGFANVRFIAGDILEPVAAGPFDAIVSRLVLMYVSNAASVLRTQSHQLRPGGIVVPIEFDLPSARSLPPTPLVAQALSWLNETFTRAGVETSLGTRLWTVVADAGLRPVGMIGIQPHFGPADPDGPLLLTGIVRAVLPLMERTGVATAADVGLETLQQRLRDELATAQAVFAHPTLLSAWGIVD
jgi:SAM-dependent methyltransferase